MRVSISMDVWVVVAVYVSEGEVSLLAANGETEDMAEVTV